MAAKNRARGKKKYFTAAQANAALPLVRAIVQDITALARDLGERRDRLARLLAPGPAGFPDPHREELQPVRAEFERDQERIQEYLEELAALGIEMKDPFTGLVDFPCWMDDREVYLCWQLGESEVGHWHELDAGFRGRRKLMADAANK